MLQLGASTVRNRRGCYPVPELPSYKAIRLCIIELLLLP